MSGKGKERAVSLSGSDSDSDAEFFTAKARTGLARAPVRDDSPIEVGDSEPSDDEAPPRKRKYKPKPKPTLPDWTRTSSKQKSRSRQGTLEPSRTSAEPIAISDSDVEVVTSPSAVITPNGKGKEREKPRRRVELTPPPDFHISEEKRAQMNKAFSDHWASIEAAAISGNLSESDSEEDEQEPTNKGPIAVITVAMVADPDMKLRASVKAIHHYEKPRIFHIPRNDPLRRIVVALGEALNKPASEIVLAHNGRRLYNVNRSPFDLGIGDQGELRGYEKSVWEKVQKEEQRKRAERIAAEASPAPSASDNDNEDRDSPVPAAASDDDVPHLADPAETSTIPKIRLIVRGEQGELKLQARLSTTTSSICRHYCNKYNVTGLAAQNMKLYFDGESFAPDTEIGDMDLEAGDLVDVR